MRPFFLAAALLALPRLAYSFTVCVLASNLGGYPLCEPGNELSYNGYDVEVFKYAASLAGWVYSPTAASLAAPPANRTWGFSCYPTATGSQAAPWMLNASMYSSCAVAIGGIGVNTQRLQAGNNFGYYVGNETAQMVIYDDSTTAPDIWSFIRPFTASLWIAFVCTLLIIPPSIWLVEQLSHNGSIMLNNHSAEDLSQSLYRNILAVFNQDVMYVGSFGGQVVMIAFLFMIMIVISTYTANLAAFNTITPPGPTYNSLLDFAGKKILVRNLFAPTVAGMYPTLNFTSSPTSWTSLQQVIGVKTGEFDVVFDSLSVINSVILSLNDCNFKIVGQGLEAASYAHVFHSLFPANIKNEWNIAIIKMASLGTFDDIAADSPQPQCSAASNNPVVSFQQVLGLWIILAGACGFGVLCAAVAVITKYFIKRRKIAAGVPEDAEPEFAGGSAEGEEEEMALEALKQKH